MAFEISPSEVWVGEVEDRPGALAEKFEALLRSGANLEFTIVRPSANVMSDSSLLFVAPLVGEEQIRGAEGAGLNRSGGPHCLRIVGPDLPGLLARIARTLADAGIRVSGLWASVLENRSVTYVQLESGAEVKRAEQTLRPVLG